MKEWICLFTYALLLSKIIEVVIIMFYRSGGIEFKFKKTSIKHCKMPVNRKERCVYSGIGDDRVEIDPHPGGSLIIFATTLCKLCSRHSSKNFTQIN